MDNLSDRNVFIYIESVSTLVSNHPDQGVHFASNNLFSMSCHSKYFFKKRFPLTKVFTIIVGVFYLYGPWSPGDWLRNYNGFFDF